ncbi:MAG: hypothetical protein ABIF10_03070 [Candidatus Woesearchaeota archaeon]
MTKRGDFLAEKVEPTIKTKEAFFKKYGRDELEAGIDQMALVDYPNAEWHYRLVNDSFSASIEESYFWILNHARYEHAFVDVEKITDIFAAAEHSAFFGVAQQRLGLQQDKVSQFLGTIGKMVKELFQLVRELRILDERISYYEKSSSPEPKIAESAEITLKGIFIDMAEGGAKSPASVYGMARELQFTTLPDLFFGTNPRNSDEVGNLVDNLEFNKSVKNVLKRKLFSFMRWKEETYKELKSRKNFTLKYLRQHFDVIKMYMSWVKPYLRNIQRLQMDHSKAETPDLIAAFEGSMVEVEFLGKFMPEGNKKYKSVLLATFEYRTMPQMSYVQEGYQRGPLHLGELKITMRPYAWTDIDIANYKKMRELDDLELLGVIDASVKAAMEALGEELEKYLEQAGEPMKKEEVARPKMELLEPFAGIGKGFGDIIKAFKPRRKDSKDADLPEMQKSKEKKSAMGAARIKMWIIYKNYKKAHRMLAW